MNPDFTPGSARLSHLGVIRARGAEAAAFLQGQLTQDVVAMAPGQARLAALCNPKGRMLASFHVLAPSADERLLVTSADVLTATLKRLSMFVMRAKVTLTDASGDFALIGQLGDAPLSIAADAGVASAGGQNDAQTAPMPIPLAPAGAVARTLWLAPAGSVADGPAIDEAEWLRAEVAAGVARITLPVVQAFVPQMLNYESVGGVNFKKGCYPGQEVVARSQFRGAIKRRAFVAGVAGAAEAGQEVFDVAAPDQPVGLIAQAAPPEGGATPVIAALQLSAQEAELAVGSAAGPRLTGLQVPYPLLQDI